MVGFDDFYEKGSDPFPCDDIRAALFRGGIRFDLGRFDVLTAATLTFDTARSISRANGETVGSSPPVVL